MTDSDQLRGCYEGVIKNNPSDAEAVQYLAVWHLERHSFQQVCYISYNVTMNIYILYFILFIFIIFIYVNIGSKLFWSFINIEKW